MFNANNFKSITSKTGSFMVLVSAVAPDAALTALGITGATCERIGFIRFTDKASADAAVTKLGALKVTLVPADGTDICNVQVTA